jgi:hypothetical protein
MSTVIVASYPDLVVIKEGPRGSAGPGVNVRGEWDSGTQYAPNDGVSWRSSATSVYSSLYIAISGIIPTLGVEPQDEPLAWAEIGLQVSDSPLGAIWTETQVAHGFTLIGTPIHFDDTSNLWVLADEDAERFCHAIIREVIDADTLILQSAGEVINMAAAVAADGFWVLGQSYALSTTPGKLTASTSSSRQNMLVITDVGGGGLGVGVLLAMDIANLTPPASEGPTPPSNPTVGDLWLRTDNYPGLYVAMPRSGGDAVWAQAN